MHPTTAAAHTEALTLTLTRHVTALAQTLVAWMLDQPRTLADLEQHLLPRLQQLGQSALTAVAPLALPDSPAPQHPCPCGQPARYLRQRPATVTTLLGPITLTRAYYHCRACGHGHAPLDAHLQLCAGSRSSALDELLALLGATQHSFAQAAAVLKRLTLVHVSPTTVRAATAELGAQLVAVQTQQAAQAQAGHDPASPRMPTPHCLYITMDGVLAHLHQDGWREVKVGCCYGTRTRPPRQPSDRPVLRAYAQSYVATLQPAEPFGWQLWAEAVRRGLHTATEVVVLGDGAHWIWNLASTLFPQATQVLDWYHASHYLWEAAQAIWGEDSGPRTAWAEAQLTRLWAGQVPQVLAVLETQRAAGAAVTEAISYYTTHHGRMDYPAYRARGLQVGSGNVESACKQLVSARLKQAGMIWTAAGAAGVAAVRAWLKSGRWDEAMAGRPQRRRGYQRQRAQPAGRAAPAGRTPAARTALPAAVLVMVQAEAAQARARHPWKQAWSRRQQHREADARRDAAAGTVTHDNS